MSKKATALGATLASLSLSACGTDAGTKLLVSTPLPEAATHSPAAARAIDCSLGLESPSSGRVSTLDATGACSFTDPTVSRCVKRPDDMYLYIHHDLPDGANLVVTVNVETYRTPGRYGSTEIYFQLTRNGVFYYWLARHEPVTVADDEKSIALEPVTLQAQAGTAASGSIHLSGTVQCTLTS